MRSVVFAAVLLMSGSVSAAQEITMVAEIPASRRTGTFQSTSYDIPVDAQGFARVIADIPSNEYEVLTNRARIVIEEQRDGVWVELAGVTWIGGRIVDPELGLNPMPFTDIYLPHFRGRRVRAILEANGFRIGARLDTSPVPFW